MTLLSFSKTIATAALLTSMALIPTTASARGSVHIDVPGFSIGFHDRHYYGKHHRYRDRHHWRHKRHFKRHYRRDHYWRPRHRGYGSGYYDRGYRNYGYAPRSRYYGGTLCPTPGYSPYWYGGGNCYAHKGHFHCDG
ncbi:MAG: hypothetical protein KJP04_10670 [Arenicella sp.]|nr:hypothetical protein [Arenicella sp.]